MILLPTFRKQLSHSYSPAAFSAPLRLGASRGLQTQRHTAEAKGAKHHKKMILQLEKEIVKIWSRLIEQLAGNVILFGMSNESGGQGR